MIEVKNLVKDYGGHLAVDHLSFTIEDGQIYGFLGPNGAGKSTTMNIMTGYIGATDGDVLINGHDIQKEPEEAKKCIGYLPELPPLYVDMTVEEQLEFAAELKKIPKAGRKEAIGQVVELAKLHEVRGRLIRNLSKGYRQRVGLAQAVLGMPSVIILDEPTVGLDPKQIIEIRDTIRELGKNHTVILSSHILSEVSAVCDHILIIDRGKLIASGTPGDLERQMAGTAGMELLVKGEKEEIEEALENVEHIQCVEITDSEEDGVLKVTFQLEAGNAEMKQAEIEQEETPEGEIPEGLTHRDIREEVFFAFADRRLPILSMQTTKATLEEVFLELTAQGDPMVQGDDGSGSDAAARNDNAAQGDTTEREDSAAQGDTAARNADPAKHDAAHTGEEEDNHDSDL